MGRRHGDSVKTSQWLKHTGRRKCRVQQETLGFIPLKKKKTWKKYGWFHNYNLLYIHCNIDICACTHPQTHTHKRALERVCPRLCFLCIFPTLHCFVHCAPFPYDRSTDLNLSFTLALLSVGRMLLLFFFYYLSAYVWVKRIELHHAWNAQHINTFFPHLL